MVCSRAPFPCFPNLYVLLFFSVVGADETSELLSPKSQAPTQINPDANQKPNPKTAEVQKEIDAVTNAMHQNLEAIAERGERMNNLQDKSDNLMVHSQNFRTQAAKVRRQMWWKNTKWTILVGILLALIIAGIVSGAIKSSRDHNSGTNASGTEEPGVGEKVS